MKSAVSEYGYINAKLRTRMGKILTEDFRSKLAAASSLEEAVQFLQDSGFGELSEVWDKTGDIQSVEFELFVRHLENYRSVIKSTEGHVRRLVEILAVKPEIENIKNALRLWYGSRIKNRPVSYKSAYIYKKRIYEDIDWTALVNAVSAADIQAVFEPTFYSPAFQIQESLIEEKGIFPLEIRLDKIYYAKLLEEGRFLNRKDYSILREIVSSEVDLQNISWIMRYRYFYNMDFSEIHRNIIPGGSALNLPLLNSADSSREKAPLNPGEILKKSYPGLTLPSSSGKPNFSAQAEMFEFLLDETRKQRFSKIITGYPFTAGIIFAYFFMCEREQSFICSALNGKLYKSSQLFGSAGS